MFYYKYLQVTHYYCYDTVTLFLSALSITVSNSPFATANQRLLQVVVIISGISSPKNMLCWCYGLLDI